MWDTLSDRGNNARKGWLFIAIRHYSICMKGSACEGWRSPISQPIRDDSSLKIFREVLRSEWLYLKLDLLFGQVVSIIHQDVLLENDQASHTRVNLDEIFW